MLFHGGSNGRAARAQAPANSLESPHTREDTEPAGVARPDRRPLHYCRRRAQVGGDETRVDHSESDTCEAH